MHHAQRFRRQGGSGLASYRLPKTGTANCSAMAQRYILYGTKFSFFTAKVEGYLTWKRVPFDLVPAGPNEYADVIVPLTGVRFIPVVVSPEGRAVHGMMAAVPIQHCRRHAARS